MTLKDTTMDNNNMTIRERFQENTIFVFLDELRESGKTNMFEAVPVIVERFTITKYEAQRVLVKWMETFPRDGAECGL
tara:strand:+ start:484 stop:717 length:234 start_codon:yes stop_codon:yes gene_type:complete